MVRSGASVVVGDQGSLDGCADHPVVPDDRVEGEQPLDDASPQPGRDASAVAFESQLVLQRPDDCLDALPQPVRERTGLLLVLAAGRTNVSCRSSLVKNSSVSSPDKPLSVTTAVPGTGRLAGWLLSICRAASRSPCSLGLARPNPVTVPSQVQIKVSFVPQYQREWLGQYPYPAYPYRSE